MRPLAIALLLATGLATRAAYARGSTGNFHPPFHRTGEPAPVVMGMGLERRLRDMRGGSQARTYTFQADLQLAYVVAPVFYVGAELSFALPRPSSGAEGSHLAALAGLRFPLGPICLRFEGVLGRADGATDGSPSRRGGFFEPRALVDVWLAPTTTVTLWGGGGPAPSLGLMFSVHFREWDGARALWQTTRTPHVGQGVASASSP